MKMKVFLLMISLLALLGSASAQAVTPGYAGQPPPSLDPIANISIELTNISRSVQTLSERLKMFVDKFEKVGGLNLNEKQQRLIMGLEVLVRSEQRVATLQKSQADLVEKQIQIKQRLKQVELDLRPQSIERSTQFQGSTDTVEIRENRRDALLDYQRSMTQALQTIERNLYEAESGLREAQSHVARLRRSLLPQIEREIEGPVN
jgi:hypothetical protein